MFENSSIAVMYAVTPCHAGSGSGLGVVDNPIQRERATNWPVIQASGIKGAFRANFEMSKHRVSNATQYKDLTESIFGTDKGGADSSGYAGSSSFSDAKILAFPMRSSVAPFVWITCPSVLKRLSKDLFFAGKIKKDVFEKIEKEIPEMKEQDAICVNGNLKGDSNKALLIEDCEVKLIDGKIPEVLAEYLKTAERLIVVADEVFRYGVSDCTQIMAQIKIDPETGTANSGDAKGSLRYQEELPADTIMYCVVVWGNSKNSENKLQADMIKKFITEEAIGSHIQVAGDETLGRGIFQLDWK